MARCGASRIRAFTGGDAAPAKSRFGVGTGSWLPKWRSLTAALIAIGEVADEAGEVLQEQTRRAGVAEHEGRLVEVPQAAAEPEPIVAGDYTTRDICAVVRQKTLHPAPMKRSHFRFHPATPPAWSRGLQLWLRPRPR